MPGDTGRVRPLLEARPELDLGCSCGVARGGLVLTGAAFDLAEVLVGLGRECVEPTLREMIEHRLERRAGRVEFPGPHGPNSHRHARSGVRVRERARPPERHGACDAISSILTGEELADPEHSERLRGQERVAKSLGDVNRALGFGRSLRDIAPVDPRPREICPDPALHLWIARRVVQTRMEVAPDEIHLHPRSIRQAPQDVGLRPSFGRRSRHLQEQFLRADRVTGVEEMAGGLDAAANVTRDIGGRGELAGQGSELRGRFGRTPGAREACCVIESRGDRCVRAARSKGEVPGPLLRVRCTVSEGPMDGLALFRRGARVDGRRKEGVSEPDLSGPGFDHAGTFGSGKGVACFVVQPGCGCNKVRRGLGGSRDDQEDRACRGRKPFDPLPEQRLEIARHGQG